MLSYEPQGPIPNFSGLRDVPERDRCASPLSRRMFSTQVHGLQRTKVARDVDLGRVGLSHAAALSAGQLTYIDQKRLELARALALAPDVLLLDEWLAGLNPSELHEGIALVKSLRDQGLTIVIVEHVMDAIRSLCDCCVVMNAGRKIAEGPAAAVLSDPEVIRAYLGDADA